MKTIGYYSSINEKKDLPLNLTSEKAMEYLSGYFEVKVIDRNNLIQEALEKDPKGTIKWLAQFL